MWWERHLTSVVFLLKVRKQTNHMKNVQKKKKKEKKKKTQLKDIPQKNMKKYDPYFLKLKVMKNK